LRLHCITPPAIYIESRLNLLTAIALQLLAAPYDTPDLGMATDVGIDESDAHGDATGFGTITK
jgi:hypothetical protein